MTRWALIQELRAAASDPARVGDVPALKSELGGTRAAPEVEALLDDVRHYRPPLDLDALAALPAGTFGHEYARFLRDNGLSPIVLSGQLDPELVARNAFVVRYGIIHDMVHVLTGFDTSWPGEVGVWAYVGAQGYSRTFRLSALLALFAALVRCPLRLGEAWAAYKKGQEMAARSKLLLTLRLEDALGRDLEELRAELGLEDGGPGYITAAG